MTHFRRCLSLSAVSETRRGPAGAFAAPDPMRPGSPGTPPRRGGAGPDQRRLIVRLSSGLLALTTALGAAAAEPASDAAAPPHDGAASAGDKSGIALKPVTVEDRAATVPSATSSTGRDQIGQIPPSSPIDLLTGIPGTFAQYDGTPGLSVSIRGLQDFGRVNVMIDGARQDFQMSGHSANGTVFVDPALLSGVDVARGTVATADGAGAIGGAVNLRTIGIDDVLRPGQHYGVTTTDMFGTNHYDGSGMIAGGARADGGADIVAAFSLRSSGDYRDGDGRTAAATHQRLQSGLIKTDVSPGPDQTLQVGAVVYHNDFASGTEDLISHDSVDQTTVTAKYRWTPDNPLLDLRLNGFYTDTQLEERTPSFVAMTRAPANTTRYHLTTVGFDTGNVSRFALGPVAASIDYGGEYFDDRVSTSDQAGNAGATPGGSRDVGGVFTQATFAWKGMEVIPALRYDLYSLSGSGFNRTGGFTGARVGAFDIDKTDAKLSPKLTLAVTPITGVQLYGSYGLGFRPPSTTETLFSGAHPGLSFLRFVPNPDLMPERTRGGEIGAKIETRDILKEGDSLSFQADIFDTRIRHYINQTLVRGAPDPASRSPIPLRGYFYQNMPGTAKTQGGEVQGSYDARIAFASLSYTSTMTKLGAPDYTGFDHILTTPPHTVVAATAGIRLLDERLTIGERTRAASASWGQPASGGKTTAIPGYVVADIFGSYQATQAFRVFTSIENIGDVRYVIDQQATTPSPGLTAKVGFTVSFGG